MNRNQPQLYGTQFYDDPQKGYTPREIEAIEKLEERRKEMDLRPFEEYRRALFEKYKIGEK